MSDIPCAIASWLGVNWDRCKGSTVAKKIDTPVGVGCKEKGEPEKPKVEVPSKEAVPNLKTEGEIGEELTDGRSIFLPLLVTKSTLEGVDDLYTLHYGIKNSSKNENLALRSVEIAFIGVGKTDSKWVLEISMEEKNKDGLPMVIKPGETHKNIVSNFGRPLREAGLGYSFSFGLAQVKVKVNYIDGSQGSFVVEAKKNIADWSNPQAVKTLCSWQGVSFCGKVGETLSDGKIGIITEAVTKEINRPPFPSKVYYRLKNSSRLPVTVTAIESTLYSTTGSEVAQHLTPPGSEDTLPPGKVLKFVMGPEGERFMGEIYRIGYKVKYKDGAESRYEVVVDRTLDPSNSTAKKIEAEWLKEEEKEEIALPKPTREELFPKSKVGITSKAAWELTEEESEILQGLLKNIYVKVLGKELVKLEGSPLFYEVTVHMVKEGDSYKQLPNPLKTLGALINYPYPKKPEDIKRELSQEIKSKQAERGGNALRITEFDIEIMPHGGSMYGPPTYMVTITPHSVEIEK